jgi:hypothetical protein
MSRKHSTALGIGAALSGAAVATFLSMGTAHADADGYEDLFGAPGTAGLSSAQTADNLALDTAAFQSNPGNAAAFDTLVDSFENSGTAHPLEQLFFGIDPSAFAVQHDVDITGYLTAAQGAGDAGGYLVPDDFLGYLATDLDAYLLNPTGLGPLLLGPLIDVLLGFPASP